MSSQVYSTENVGVDLCVTVCMSLTTCPIITLYLNYITMFPVPIFLEYTDSQLNPTPPRSDIIHPPLTSVLVPFVRSAMCHYHDVTRGRDLGERIHLIGCIFTGHDCLQNKNTFAPVQR